MQMVMFMKNFAIAGGLLFLVVLGPDTYALDNRTAAKCDTLATDT